MVVVLLRSRAPLGYRRPVDTRTFGEALVTLLVILDPLGGIPVFLSLTARMGERERHRAAFLAVAVAAAVVLGFAFFGELLLDYLNVSIEALMIAGGVLLFLVALEMLRGEHSLASEGEASVALVPLGTPLLGGPGAIVATMVLMRQHPVGEGRAGVVGGVVVALLGVLAALRLASWCGRYLSPGAIAFVTRIMGLLLTAIAVQLMVQAAMRWVRLGLG
jgi:multiple antibiotic resistance protein